MQKFVIIFILVCSSAFASEWQTIRPIASCNSFFMRYKYDEVTKNYQVQFPKSPDNLILIDQDIQLENINDLSPLQNDIFVFAQDFCNDLYLDSNGTNSCEFDNGVLSDDYDTFLTSIIQKIKATKDPCDFVLELEKAADSIAGIHDIRKESRTSTKHFFKAFVDSESDEMIDYYKQCGSKPASAKFIKNMIMLEAKKACIVPKPPGYLNWDETEAIAESISKDYSNLNLMQMYGKVDELTNNAYLTFSKEVLRSTLKDIYRDDTDDEKDIDKEKALDAKVDPLFEKLNSFKNLETKIASTQKKLENPVTGKKEPASTQINNYLTHGFMIDVQFEAAEVMAEDMIIELSKEQLKETLKGVEDDEIDSIIKDKVLPNAMKEYYQCINSQKEKVGLRTFSFEEKSSNPNITSFPLKSKNQLSSESDYKQLENRKKLVCKKDSAGNCVENTEKTSCEESSEQYLGSDKEIKDIDKITACVYGGALRAIPSLIETLLQESVKKLKGEFLDLSPERVTEYSDLMWSDIQKCLNKKEVIIDSNNEVNYEHLQTVDTTKFKDDTLACVDVSAEKAYSDIIKKVFLSHKDIKTVYSTDELKDGEELVISNCESANSDYILLLGDCHHKSAVEKVDGIMDETFYKCIEKQKELIKIPNSKMEKTNPLICLPQMEILTTSLVVKKKVNDLLEEKGYQENEDLKEIISNYEACVDKSAHKSFQRIGNLTDPLGIHNEEDAKSYLDQEPDFKNCTTNLIGSMSNVIGQIEFTKTIDKQAQIGNIKDFGAAKSLKEEAGQLVQACFEEELSQFSNWTETRKALSPEEEEDEEEEENKPDFFEMAQKKCTDKVSFAIVPPIIEFETRAAFEELIQDELIYQGGEKEKQYTSILLSARDDMEKKYGVEVPSSVPQKDRFKYIIEQSFNRYTERNSDITDPEIMLKGFTDEYSVILEKHTLSKVYDNVFEEVLLQTSDLEQKNQFKSFKDSVPNQCFDELYTKYFKGNKPTDESVDESTKKKKPITAKSLGSYIQKALEYHYLLDKKGHRPGSKYKEAITKIENDCANLSKYKTANDFYKSDLIKFIIKGQIPEMFISQFKTQVLEAVDREGLKITHQNRVDKEKILAQKKQQIKELFRRTLENPAIFDQIYFEDNNLLDYTAENVSAMMSGTEAAAQEVEDKITEKLFNKLFVEDGKGKEIFGEKFTEIQLVGGIAIGGIDKAVTKAGDRVVGKKLAIDNTKDVFKNTNEIRKAFNWNDIKKENQDKFILSIYKNGIDPRLKYPLSRKLEPIRDDIIRKHFLKQIDGHVITSSCEISKGEICRRQFSQAQDIYKSIITNIAKDLGPDATDKAVEKEVKKVLSTPPYFTEGNPFPIDKSIMIEQKDLFNSLVIEVRSELITQQVEVHTTSYKYSDEKNFEEKVKEAISDGVYDDIDLNPFN